MIRFLGACGSAIVFCLVVFVSLQAAANALDGGGGTAKSSDANMIDAYYYRCLNTIYQDQETETREEFCSCTAAHMEGTLTYAEIKTMATGKGQPVDQKTLALKVMAPCLAAPLAELEYKACMGDTRYAHLFASENAYSDTCRCMSNGMGQYVDEYAVDLLGYLLTQNPDLTKDPAAAVRESAAYLQEAANQRNKCLTDNIYQ